MSPGAPAAAALDAHTEAPAAGTWLPEPAHRPLLSQCMDDKPGASSHRADSVTERGSAQSRQQLPSSSLSEWKAWKGLRTSLDNHVGPLPPLSMSASVCVLSRTESHLFLMNPSKPMLAILLLTSTSTLTFVSQSNRCRRRRAE